MIFRTGVIDSTWASCQSLRNIPDSFKKIGFIRLHVLERVQVEELNKCTPHSRYFSDELGVQFFFDRKKNICLLLAEHMVYYKYGEKYIYY